jgi:hypothetical protein
MEQSKSLFISSCTRREMARRRPGRSAGRLELFIGMTLLVAALLAFVVVRGGI